MSADEYLEDKRKLIDACILASEKNTYNMKQFNIFGKLRFVYSRTQQL